MLQRIVKTKGCKTADQVLLSVCRTEDGTDTLFIECWHEQKDWLYYQQESIDGDLLLLKRIIYDFSEASATEFANSMTF